MSSVHTAGRYRPEESSSVVTSLRRAVNNDALLGRDRSVVVAVSGGADSMALLSGLSDIAAEAGITVAAAHFDHQLRDDSADDGELVESFARSLGVDCHCGGGDVAARARSRRKGIEEAGRHMRYAFLESVADSIGATRIVTAHTRSDQVETVLMRIIRGAGIRGLAGIPERRDRMVRPLLSVPREDTEAHCRAAGVAYVEDPSNRVMRFLRNRVRHLLLPVLRAGSADTDHNLLRVAGNAQRAVSAARRHTQPLIEHNLSRFEPGVWVLALQGFDNLSAEASYVLMGDVVNEHVRLDAELTRNHYYGMTALAAASVRSGKSLSLPAATVRREYDALVFYVHRERRNRWADGDAQVLTVPGRARVGGWVVQTEWCAAPPDARATADGRTAWLCLDCLKSPLVARRATAGERIRPLGMPGSKKLSDVFSDRKIPLRQREAALIIADAREILWLAGVTTSETARVTEQSQKIAKIRIEPE